ncbi:MAG: RimK family alpha-L-glutamate ligase [Deltaproteobacteria bacterium]|jgi:ribosomal protein S6--L-glutamate ligase|nr:RimK family alpha-L-glutamate ligase [Deltaproteobacteria bacterium]
MSVASEVPTEIAMGKEFPEYIALGSRLNGVPEVLTLGVRPNFYDYTAEERRLMLNAACIFYPSLNYAQYFTTIGKKIFPSVETYLYAGQKMKQTTLFNMLDIPHPKTKIYLKRQFDRIENEFSFPFIAKIPRASSRGRGVFKISGSDQLQKYLHMTKFAYIQEFLEHEKDLRVILINYQPILAYWRKIPQGDFRANLFQGGVIDFDDIPADALELASDFARKCNFNDVGLDLLQSNGKWYLIEANMQYGREALKKKNMVLKEIIREKLLTGTLLD